MKFSVDECMFVWCNSNPIVVRAEKKKKIKMFQNFAKNIGKVITITVVEYLQASCCLDELGPLGAVRGGSGVGRAGRVSIHSMNILKNSIFPELEPHRFKIFQVVIYNIS
jgi:hypothetical protein